MEDNRDALRYLSLVLVGHGHDVYTATSLAEARSAAAATDIDLLVSDIELPDGSGIELMRNLQSEASPGSR